MIAKGLNISILFGDLGTSTKGFYQKVLRRKYIFIHNELSDEWKRFVCAHELGHDRLHSGWGYYFIENHTFFSTSKFEREANIFAIKLLTFYDQLQEGETIEEYLLRNNVPRKMHAYFF
jgi:Zn-dependent peptidase ImmA (M78 family)